MLTVGDVDSVVVAVGQKLTEGEMEADTVLEYVALPL